MLEKVVRIASDNNHKNQAVAQKLVMDRLLPISTFEKAVDSREKINIVIKTRRPSKETIEGEVIEQRSRSIAQQIKLSVNVKN